MNRVRSVRELPNPYHNLIIGLGCLLLTTGLLVSCGQGGTPSQESSTSEPAETAPSSEQVEAPSSMDGEQSSSSNVEAQASVSEQSKSTESPSNEPESMQDNTTEQEQPIEQTEDQVLSLDTADTEVQRAVDKFDIDLDNVGEPMDEVTLVGRKLKFDKHVIVAKKGEPFTINFNNDGFITHNISVPEFEQKSETIQPDNTTSITFTPDKAGYHWFYCDVAQHKRAGMQGVFVVKN